MQALGKNGVLVLASVTGGERKIEVPADKINLDFVLGNKVMVGTVNANREYFELGVRDMAQAEAEYPGLAQAAADPPGQGARELPPADRHADHGQGRDQGVLRSNLMFCRPAHPPGPPRMEREAVSLAGDLVGGMGSIRRPGLSAIEQYLRDCLWMLKGENLHQTSRGDDDDCYGTPLRAAASRRIGMAAPTGSAGGRTSATASGAPSARTTARRRRLGLLPARSRPQPGLPLGRGRHRRHLATTSSASASPWRSGTAATRSSRSACSG